MYKVIKFFHDLEDKQETKSGPVYHAYNVGDVYPREGFNPSDGRIEELSGNENKRGEPLIELVEEVAEEAAKEKAEEKPKTTRKRTIKKTEE